MKGLALLLIVGSLSLVACGQATSSAHTGVAGRVLLSGGPAPGITRPYPTSVVKAIDASGKTVAVAKPRSDATYRIDLPPGTYTLKAQPTSGNPWFGPEKVVVHAGHYSKVDIYAQVP